MVPSGRSYVWVVRLMVAVAVAAVAVLASPASAARWRLGSNGTVFYSLDCDFYGNDLFRQSTRGEDCGGLCVRTRGCSHFTWNKGNCFLKKGGIRLSDATYYKGAVCGVRRRSR